MSSPRLSVATPTDLEIVLTRRFNAPRDLVWEAMSKPELIKQWLFGPPGWTMTKCEDDLRVGGEFRWAWSGPDGVGMEMHGVYREVIPPERMVRTEVFDFGCVDVPGGAEQLCTLVLDETNEQTTLTLTVRYPSKQARDMALATGMEKGVSAGYDRLDQMLAERKRQIQMSDEL
jgi:uncharacterized protein YndB with AHSA1/START domain